MKTIYWIVILPLHYWRGSRHDAEYAYTLENWIHSIGFYPQQGVLSKQDRVTNENLKQKGQAMCSGMYMTMAGSHLPVSVCEKNKNVVYGSIFIWQ